MDTFKPFTVNKFALVQKIIAHLESELDLYAKSARAAHEEATHEQSKAENKYDTRGLEASYLAHGQSRQAAETELAYHHFKSLELRDFGPTSGIDVGALVKLQSGSEQELYFVGPRAGGIEIEHEGQTVLVITPQSPLGRQLVGKRQGDKFKIETGRPPRELWVIAVS